MNLYNLILGNITQEELLNYYNAAIDYINLPLYIYGFVFNYKDTNIIAINKNLPYFLKKKAILHELAHIELNQLNQIDKDLFAFKIEQYEDEADKYVEFLLDIDKVD